MSEAIRHESVTYAYVDLLNQIQSVLPSLPLIPHQCNYYKANRILILIETSTLLCNYKALLQFPLDVGATERLVNVHFHAIMNFKAAMQEVLFAMCSRQQ